MNRQKEPLYRKQNKLALSYIRCTNTITGSFRHERNTKAVKNFEGTHMPMNSINQGRDYTPLYKFLLSKVGCKWDEVYSEAVSRLDKTYPIFYLVILDVPEGRYPVVRIGEGTLYSMLTVNSEGILVKVDAEAGPMKPACTCCTHSFNGKPYKYGYSWEELSQKYTDI